MQTHVDPGERADRGIVTLRRPALELRNDPPAHPEVRMPYPFTSTFSYPPSSPFEESFTKISLVDNV